MDPGSHPDIHRVGSTDPVVAFKIATVEELAT
jgi:hypothetical protein